MKLIDNLLNLKGQIGNSIARMKEIVVNKNQENRFCKRIGCKWI